MATGLRRPAARVNAVKSTRSADNSGPAGPLGGPCPARGPGLQPLPGVATRAGTHPGAPERETGETVEVGRGSPRGAPIGRGERLASRGLRPAGETRPTALPGSCSTRKSLSLFRATSDRQNAQNAPDNAISSRMRCFVCLFCAREQHQKDPWHPGPPPHVLGRRPSVPERGSRGEVVPVPGNAGRPAVHHPRRGRASRRPRADQLRNHGRDRLVHHRGGADDYRARPQFLIANLPGILRDGDAARSGGAQPGAVASIGA